MLVAPSVGSYWPQFLIDGEFAGAEMKICRGSPDPREIIFVRLLKKQYELLSFGALCNLKAKMHTITTSKFWKIKLMDANFFYYSIYDRFIQRQPCAWVYAFVNFFFKKNFSSETIDWTFTKFYSSQGFLLLRKRR